MCYIQIYIFLFCGVEFSLKCKTQDVCTYTEPKLTKKKVKLSLKFEIQSAYININNAFY